MTFSLHHQRLTEKPHLKCTKVNLFFPPSTKNFYIYTVFTFTLTYRCVKLSIHFFFFVICFPPVLSWHCALFHLTLEPGSTLTLLSLATGSPGTTAFIIGILSCQVALHTCQEGLKGTAQAPLLCCSAWFFIALHRRRLRTCFQPYVNIIHFLVWQLRTVEHCGAHSFTKPCLHSRGLELTTTLPPTNPPLPLCPRFIFTWCCFKSFYLEKKRSPKAA